MLERLFINLGPLVHQINRRPWVIVNFSVLFAVIGFLLALNLRIDNDLSKLIPESYPSVQALEKLREQVGGSNELVAVIESSSFEMNKTFAEQLIPRAMQLNNPADGEPYFTHVEYRKEIDFLKSNALYFATDEELDLLEDFLNEEIEIARLKANPFYFELDEDTKKADSLSRELDQAYTQLVGSEYPISADSLTMAIRFHPGGSGTDIEYIRNVYRDMGLLVQQLQDETGTDEIRVVLAGRLLRTLIEIDSIYDDVRNSFGAGVLMLLILVMSYFFYKSYKTRSGGIHSASIILSELKRTPLTALILGLPLIISLCWTFGITWLAFQTLNIMTSTLGLLLFGMGIDFGIHFYARYIEERSEGASAAKAVETTFMTTGQAITAVGITTSAAFFILMIADFKGFSEFGFIAGIGILFSIIAMTVLLPAMLVLLEKYNLLQPEFQIQKLIHNGKSGHTGRYIQQKTLAVLVVIISLSASILAGFYVPNISFEYDFGKLEPEFESYNEIAREARKVYSDQKTRNAAYIISETPDDAVHLQQILNRRIAADTLNQTIRSVETLQSRYPFSSADQLRKLNRIDGIRQLLDDPFLQVDGSEEMERLRRAASTSEPIPIESVPDFILKPFTAKDGSVGNLVIIYPAVSLADGRNSMNFADDLSNIILENGKIYHAGSTSIVASDMLRLMIRETPAMIAYTLTFIILIKLIIFRSIKWMLLALLPLAASFLWLFGLIEISGWKLNFYNIVVLPTILGIGDDSGIHIIHRYLEEGTGSIARVIRSTGEHITASAFTTMLGFTGLLFSAHPGMRSIGELAVTGIGLMLLASLVMLPSLLYLLERSGQAKKLKSGYTKSIPASHN